MNPIVAKVNRDDLCARGEIVHKCPKLRACALAYRAAAAAAATEGSGALGARVTHFPLARRLSSGSGGADEGFLVRMRGWHWIKDRGSDFIWWPIGNLKSGWLRLGWGYRRRCLTWLRNSCLLSLMSPTPRWSNFLSCEEETLNWDRNIEMDNKERQQVNNGHRVQDAFYFYQLLD